MFKNFSPGLFFGLMAVMIVISTPFIMIFEPIFLSLIITTRDPSSLFIPSPFNMRLVLIGSIALVGTLGLLAYKRNKLIYVVSSLLFIIGIGAWYFSSQNHISINQDYISKQVFFNKYQYQWKQIDEIVYEYAMSGKGDYTFTAKTGEQFIIKENELRTDAKGQIYKTAIQNDIPYTERAK